VISATVGATVISRIAFSATISAFFGKSLIN